MGNLGRAKLGGNHVEDKPGLVALPTVYHWKLIQDQVYLGLQLNQWPGPRSLYVEGGIHLTANSFLPEALLKELTATEDQFYSGFVNTQHLLSLSQSELDEEQRKLYNLENMQCWKDMTVPVESCKEVSIGLKDTNILSIIKNDPQVIPSEHLPWHLSCNRDRFPYWFGKTDPRNVDLLKASPAIARSVAEVPQVYSVPSPVQRVFPIDRVTDPESQNKTECIRITYIEDPYAVNS